MTKKLWIGTLAGIGLVVLTVLSARAPHEPYDRDMPASPPRSAAPSGGLAVAQFRDVIAETDSELIDVRTPEEYASGRIPGAMNLDVQDPSFSSRVAELDRSKSYALYCRSGNRSARAVALMNDAGFTNVVHLAGGIVAWKDAGMPVE